MERIYRPKNKPPHFSVLTQQNSLPSQNIKHKTELRRICWFFLKITKQASHCTFDNTLSILTIRRIRCTNVVFFFTILYFRRVLFHFISSRLFIKPVCVCTGIYVLTVFLFISHFPFFERIDRKADLKGCSSLLIWKIVYVYDSIIYVRIFWWKIVYKAHTLWKKHLFILPYSKKIFITSSILICE